jgi:NitT/TauT family transport system permease protein
MKKTLALADILFLVTLLLLFLPGEKETAPPFAFLTAIALTEICHIAAGFTSGKKSSGAFALVFAFLIVWEISARILNIANPILIPPPENVFAVFGDSWALMLKGFRNSMLLLLGGFVSGIAAAVFSGLFIAWIPRLCQAIFPIIKIISPIPPLIYTPYIIALMPTFRAASICVIFLGVFLPMLMIIINRVSEMDKTLIDCGRALNVSTPVMLFKIVLPYCVPGIIGGLSVGISMSFMILTMAEMIGADSGLGYFVSRSAQNSEYDKVIAGIILIGVVVTWLNALVSAAKRKFMKWV